MNEEQNSAAAEKLKAVTGRDPRSVSIEELPPVLGPTGKTFDPMKDQKKGRDK